MAKNDFQYAGWNSYTLQCGTISTLISTSLHEWRGGLVVGRRTCDLVVAGSRPGRDAAA